MRVRVCVAGGWVAAAGRPRPLGQRPASSSHVPAGGGPARRYRCTPQQVLAVGRQGTGRSSPRASDGRAWCLWQQQPGTQAQARQAASKPGAGLPAHARSIHASPGRPPWHAVSSKGHHAQAMVDEPPGPGRRARGRETRNRDKAEGSLTRRRKRVRRACVPCGVRVPVAGPAGGQTGPAMGWQRRLARCECGEPLRNRLC